MEFSNHFYVVAVKKSTAIEATGAKFVALGRRQHPSSCG